MQISIKTLCFYLFFYLSYILVGQTPNPLIDKKNIFDQQRWVDSIYSKLSLEEKGRTIVYANGLYRKR